MSISGIHEMKQGIPYKILTHFRWLIYFMEIQDFDGRTMQNIGKVLKL